MLFRRQQAAEPTLEESLDEVAVRAAEAKKGRPTPKRSAAQDARKQRMAPPKDRKEAYKRQRELSRQERSATRNALVGTGSERDLPARDQGAIRRFVRDYIDSRRTLGEFFIFVGLAIVVMTFIPSVEVRTWATTAWLALLVLFIFEGFLLSRRLKKEMATRFPDPNAQQGRRGAVFYGVMRSFQLRRLRLPKPQVTPGTQV